MFSKIRSLATLPVFVPEPECFFETELAKHRVPAQKINPGTRQKSGSGTKPEK
jgi:hypothetical protein